MLHFGRKQVSILMRNMKIRKITEQLIKSMIGSVEVNITSNQWRTFLAAESDLEKNFFDLIKII